MGIEPGATYQLNPWMYMTMCLLDFPNSSVLQFATTDFFFSFINSLSLPKYLAPHLRFLCSNHNRSLGQQIICFTFTPWTLSILLFPDALIAEIRMITNCLTFKICKVRELLRIEMSVQSQR